MNKKSKTTLVGWGMLALLLLLVQVPVKAQYAGRQGRTDELAEYARHKKKKVAIARTYILQADSNGSIATAEKQLVEVRHFDAGGRVRTDTIFHFTDGLPYLARALQYQNGRQVSSEEHLLSEEAPTVTQMEFHFNEDGILYQITKEGGYGDQDTTLFNLDEQGNISYFVRYAGTVADTTLCELNAEGRLAKTTTTARPPTISEFSYNKAGQLTRMTEMQDYGLLGQSDITIREFEYGKKGLLRTIRDFDSQGTLQGEFQMDYWNAKGKKIK